MGLRDSWIMMIRQVLNAVVTRWTREPGRHMPGGGKPGKLVVVLTLLLAIPACLLLSCSKGPNFLPGVVLQRNSDARKRSPIAGVEVTASLGSTSIGAQTDSSGYFTLKLRGWVRRGQPIHLEFRHSGYQPLSLDETVSDKLYVVDLAPISSHDPPQTGKPATSVANVKIRYSVKSTESVNVGSAVKTFEVVNTGNKPCGGEGPCSPDGKWKATISSTSLNAGEGNEFRNARLSCIAGPCPFTKVESDHYSEGGNKITASILNWSDTTTFLLEAEVYHPMSTEVRRDSYPVIFGRTLNFSVPDTGEGVSIEADIDGTQIVFPLGPSLCLSWANCTATSDKDHGKSYRCELKDGFGFK
jgi:hypothetical protein